MKAATPGELVIEHSLFLRKNGRWCVAVVPLGSTWRDARQIQAPKDVTGGSTERPSPAAKKWRDETLAQIRINGGLVRSKRQASPTLRECHAQLMKRRAQLPKMKASTLKNSWSHLKAQILPVEVNADPTAAIADEPLAEIGVARACAFVRAVRGRRSANHVRNVYSTVCLLWDSAQALGLVGPDVPNPFRSPLVVAELPRQQNLEDDDGDPITIPLAAAQALLDAPSEIVALERKARYAVAIFTGADDGEIAGITWKRLVKLPGRQLPLPASGEAPSPPPYVQIRGQVSLRGKDGFATEDTTKTPNRVRDIPLHPALVLALESWAARWEQLMKRKPKPTDYLFPTLSGGAARPASAPLVRSDLRAVNAMALGRGEPALVDEDRLAKITFKAWRRTFSSALEAGGVDEETRGRLMGHAGKTVTARNYTAYQLAILAGHIATIPLMWRHCGVTVTTELPPPQNSPGDVAKAESTPSVGERRGWDSNPRMTVLQTDPACGGESGDEPQSATKRGVDDSPTVGMTGIGTDDAVSARVGLTADRHPATVEGSVAAMPALAADVELDTTTSTGTVAVAKRTATAYVVPSREDGPVGPSVAKTSVVPPGCGGGVRIELDGRELARTEVREGEPLEHVDERLRLVAGQKGSR